ncbi:MAG: DUF433 domain-containing protein [Candidatus Bipolaricaulia bacterium]
MSKTRVKHPHIKESPDISEGSPAINGTRTRIIDIILEYEYLGKTPGEIVNAHPYLNLAQLHDAISYYYDYREEIDREISKRKDKIQDIRDKA